MYQTPSMNSFPISFSMSDELKSVLTTSVATSKFMLANTKFDFGKRVEQYEITSLSDLTAFELRIKETDKNEPFELSQNDILTFYSSLILSLKCFLTSAGEDFKQLMIKHNKTSEKRFEETKQTYLSLAARFVKGIQNDFTENKAFQDLLVKLENARII